MVRFDVVTPKYDCLDVGFGSFATNSPDPPYRLMSAFS